MTAILGAGAYAPRSFVSSETFAAAWGRHRAAGIERCAVPDADEDALTMAWEATRRALAAAGRDPASVAHLALATTTPPLAEEDLVARLASMLGVDSRARLTATVASSRAGTDVLCGVLDARESTAGVGVVVAADAPMGAPGDALGQAAGAGAAAFVLGAGEGATVTARAHGHAAAPGERFRRPGARVAEGLGVRAYDRSVFREVAVDAVEALAADLDDVDAAAIHARDGKRPYRLAGPLGLDPAVIRRGVAVHGLGYTGAAGVPLGIVGALEAGADRILAVGYGAGATADALLIDARGVPVDAAIEPTIELDYPAYLRRRGELGADEPAGGGAYVSMPAWRRSLPQRHRLEARRCRACGAHALATDGACPTCAATGGFDAVRLPGTGTVEAVTTIEAGGAPPEFAPYQSRVGAFQTAIVAFDAPEDRTVSLPAMVVSTDEVANGSPVEAVIRRLYTQEGVPRYGRKVRAVDG